MAKILIELGSSSLSFYADAKPVKIPLEVLSMCYSAMVEQDAKTLARRFNANVQTDFYADLFRRRSEGEKLHINKAMEIPFLHNATTMQERAIAKVIRAWHESESLRLKAELKRQEARLEKAESELKIKETKKALDDRRIATNKISKCRFDLERHESEKLEFESESRIYPLHYVSILCLNEKGEKVIMPMRYLMRPHDAGKDFDKTHGGCYNARFDKLTLVPFWKDSLEKRRGIMVIKKFYENVLAARYQHRDRLPDDLKGKENIVVRFEPKGVDEMFVPVLWDCWKGEHEAPLYSTALITDDPAPEVKATGHDRTPIFLKESGIDLWLRDSVLTARENAYYEHEVKMDRA